MIPDHDCKKCGVCCGPIFWSMPEDKIIRRYLEENNMNYIEWSVDQYKENDFRCPYQKDNACMIYPVRPMICRMQGVSRKLPCEIKSSPYISKSKEDTILRAMKRLEKEVGTYKICAGPLLKPERLEEDKL